MERLYIGIAVIFIFGLGIIFLVRAEVKVGTGTVILNESIGTSIGKNIIGDFLGYGRCPITNLSF